MGKLSTGLTTALAAAVGAAAFLAYRVSRDTGRGLVDSVKEVPAEAQRYYEELRMRGGEAYEAGKQAARQKQDEIEEQLRR